MPAFIISFNTSCLLLAGPIVQTIFTLGKGPFIFIDFKPFKNENFIFHILHHQEGKHNGLLFIFANNSSNENH